MQAQVPRKFLHKWVFEAWQDARTACVRTDIWKTDNSDICLNKLQDPTARSTSAALKTFSRRRIGPGWLSIISECQRVCVRVSFSSCHPWASPQGSSHQLVPSGGCGSAPSPSHETCIKGCRRERSEMAQGFHQGWGSLGNLCGSLALVASC